jgi:hypothetical protein
MVALLEAMQPPWPGRASGPHSRCPTSLRRTQATRASVRSRWRVIPKMFGRAYLARAFVLLAILSACDRTPVAPKAGDPSFVPKDFAKNPDADCEAHQSDYYEELVAKPNGLQDLIFLHCQLAARRSWHGARARDLAAAGHGEAFKKELATAMRCERENVAVLAAMRKIGIINIPC